MSGEHINGKYEPRDFLVRLALTFVINIILLGVSDFFPYVAAGTEVRVAAFVPIVFGIIWGMPAAVGVALSNMAYDALNAYDPVSILLGGLVNGAVTILAYRLFYMFRLENRNLYVYDSKSLTCFLVTVTASEIVMCACVSMLLTRFSGIDPIRAFSLTFCNNMIYATVIGLMVMLILPSIKHKASRLHPERTDKWRYASILLIASPILFFILFSAGVYRDAEAAVLISVLCMLVFVCLGPETPTDYRDDEFRSLKYRGFRTITGMSLIVGMVIAVFVGLLVRMLCHDDQTAVQIIYAESIFIMVVVTISFATVQGVVERKITKPMYEITSHLRNDRDGGLDEVDVLKDRLDFASDLTEDVGGNEYRLYIGLTTKDGRREIDSEEAKSIINGICLRYVSGYMSAKEMAGGYSGKEAECNENVLVYTIYGATDEQIKDLVTDVISVLDQESIMIEKNRVARWYHRDGTSEDA